MAEAQDGALYEEIEYAETHSELKNTEMIDESADPQTTERNIGSVDSAAKNPKYEGFVKASADDGDTERRFNSVGQASQFSSQQDKGNPRLSCLNETSHQLKVRKDFDDLEERKDSGEQRADGHVGQYDASMMESPKHGYDQQQAVYVSINSASY